jgi:SAM-dependent methyltransferase
MNLFRPAMKAGQFDVVLCNGVLHHTSDPYGGFQRIAELVKPGGHIVLGLYNRYGRWLTDARRMVFNASGGRLSWIDPYLRRRSLSHGKRDAWFSDQYEHPCESKHTMGEMLGWFDETGFEFVNAVPKTRVWDQFDARERLFEPAMRGTTFDLVLAQAKMIFTGTAEGGFQVMIGKKRGEP